MHIITTQSSNPRPDIFGAGYVHEQHSETALWDFRSSLMNEVNKSLTISMFDEMLKSLRAALSLR